jgi:hypothetical protein
MGAATCQGQAGTGSSVSWANAEGGIKWNLADSISDTTTPIAIPTATGTVFSWIKNLALAVTGTGTTNISNRRVSLSGSPSTGLNLWFKAVAVGSYAQAASGNRPSSSGSNGATPTGYTAIATSTTVYDSSSVSSGSTGPNGSMCVSVLGVDNSFTGGAGTNVSVPSIILTYDEA